MSFCHNFRLPRESRTLSIKFRSRSLLHHIFFFVSFKWWLHQLRYTDVLIVKYTRITSTNSTSFCMTTFRASLTNLTARLPQSRDCSCYVSRPILALPQLWLQKHDDLRAQDFAQSPELWRQPRLANIPCAWRRRLCVITPAILRRIRVPDATKCWNIN
jgi:hypothetical protein